MSEPASDAKDAPMPAEAATPATPAPATAAAQPTAEPATAPAETAAAQPAPAQSTTQESQVATIVNTEFATYDKDGNGSLDQNEFGAWMIALRVKAQPGFVADSPESKAWVTAAFTQADSDKSASVNATELTSFLTPKPAA